MKPMTVLEYDRAAEELREPGSPPFTGEQLLLEALMEYAIVERDIEWVSDSTASHPDYFTFEFCCLALNLTASRIRQVLLQKFSVDTKRTDYTRRLGRPIIPVDDVPGEVYTHAYGQCPGGLVIKRCDECTSRYNYAYRKRQRRLLQTEAA